MQLEKLTPKTDVRGSFVEAIKLPNDGQVSYLIINPGELRGNHYHLRKIEKFVVAYGSAIVTCKDIETDNIMKVEVSSDSPMSIGIYPKNIHNIYSEDGCVCIIWCNEQFNQEDPDTFPEEI